MTSCRVSQLLLVSCAAISFCRAQDWISVGVKGGVPLTDTFADRSVQQVQQVILHSINPFEPPLIPFGPPLIVSQTTRYFGGSRNFVLGPTVELRLPFGLAVEADALYRPMEFQIQATTSLSFFSTRVTLAEQGDAWEFPILAKYRLPLPVVKPYLAAGPSFRATSSALGKYMSGTGVSAGIGIETRIGPLLIAPEVRYTHWGADGTYASRNHLTSFQNQVEFLMGLTTRSGAPGTTSPSAAGWRKYLAVGVKGGLPFTTAFISDSYGRVTYPSVSCEIVGLNVAPCPISEATVEYHRASRNYLVGPSVEVHLPLHLSIEGDALYGPLSVAAPPSRLGFFPSIQTMAPGAFRLLVSIGSICLL